MKIFKVIRLDVVLPSSAVVSLDYRRTLGALCEINEWKACFFMTSNEDEVLESISKLFVERFRGKSDKQALPHILEEFEHSHVNVTISEQSPDHNDMVHADSFTEGSIPRALSFMANI